MKGKEQYQKLSSLFLFGGAAKTDECTAYGQCQKADMQKTGNGSIVTRGIGREEQGEQNHT